MNAIRTQALAQRTSATASALALALLATLGMAAASNARAQEAVFEPVPVQTSNQTRALVQAELAKARADGSIGFSRAGYIEPLRDSRTREAVRAETQAALASGELRAIQGEVYTWSPASVVRLAQSR